MGWMVRPDKIGNIRSATTDECNGFLWNRVVYPNEAELPTAQCWTPRAGDVPYCFLTEPFKTT